jgi:beta-phosphoglucomutase-like phosphatase (HAD superfamily)
VNAVVGAARLSQLDVVIAGDDVDQKKPHPMIYNAARAKLGLAAR